MIVLDIIKQESYPQNNKCKIEKNIFKENISNYLCIG